MDPALTPIASNAFAQYGALGLLAVSGYIVAWFLWKALGQARTDFAEQMKAVRADLAAINERVISALEKNSQAMTLLAERLRSGS